MRTKYIIRLIVGIFLLFLIWRIVLLIVKDGGSSLRQFDRPPVAVEVDSVRYESIQEMRQFTGSIYPLYQYIVAPRVSGRIIKINKRIGDWVKRGEIVAKIDDAEYQQMLLEAEANLRISQANLAEIESQLELAKQDLERVQLLQQQELASPAELDKAVTTFNALQSRMKLAQAQVEQRQAALTSARIRLGYTVLVAAKPGFVGERFVDEGGLLAPNAPVMSIIGIDTVIVRTTVIERVYGRIQLGYSAEIEVDAFPAKSFYGSVSRIAPMLQEASRVAQMEIVVSNDSLFLKPGMFTKVNVVLAEKDSVQVIPTKAIVNRNGMDGVFVIENGQSISHYIPVQLGISTPIKTEVVTPRIDGLVVTLGQHLLEDGSSVILPDNYKAIKKKS